MEQKNRYERFKSRPIVPGKVFNLRQLGDSHCPVSFFLKTQKLSLLFSICRLDIFEVVVRVSYENLRIYNDSGELETLVMISRIMFNGLSFEDVFGTKFSSVIPHMNGV